MNAKADLQRLKLATSNSKPTRDNDAGDEPPIARTEVLDNGVFFIGTTVDPKSGSTTELPPMWLCDRLEILGRGRDENRDFYRVLRWHSRGNHQEHPSSTV